MPVIIKEPLNDNFYAANGWQDSMTKYYADERHVLARESVEGVLKYLTVAIEKVIQIYGDFPEPVYKALRQTVNPLYEIDEYKNEVYNAIREAAKKEDRKIFYIVAEALFIMRRLFEKNKEFLEANFAKEIRLTSGGSEEDKFEYFSDSVKTITKTHVIQVAKMIASRR